MYVIANCTTGADILPNKYAQKKYFTAFSKWMSISEELWRLAIVQLIMRYTSIIESIYSGILPRWYTPYIGVHFYSNNARSRHPSDKSGFLVLDE